MLTPTATAPVTPAKKVATRPISVADLTLATRKAELTLKFFVAGPYIERGWDAAKLASAPASALLRIETIRLIESDLQHHVILGEHRGVAELADRNLESRATVMLSEIEINTYHSHGIIIIPDSPGSFCELGSWVMNDDLCRKMLVLGNDKFSSSISYVGTGVFKAAEDEGAIVRWVNYEDLTSVAAIVADFVKKTELSVLSRNVKAGRRG